MENYIGYIKMGVGFFSPSGYVKMCLTLFIFAFLGLVPAIVLRGFWIALFVAMVLVAAGATISACVLKIKGLSTKNDLIMQTIMYGGWTFELVLLECVVLSNYFGVGLYIFFLFLQPFILPLILAFFNERSLKHEKIKSQKGTLITAGSTFGTGIVGMILGRIFFKDADQMTAAIFILCACSIFVFLFSMGLISIHQLYHLKKYEKEFGPFPD